MIVIIIASGFAAVAGFCAGILVAVNLSKVPCRYKTDAAQLADDDKDPQ